MSGKTDKQKPAAVDADMQAQFAALGVSVAQSAEPDEAIEVWARNWPSLMAFLACETQWRVAAGLGGVIRLGLDYAAVDIVMRRAAAGDAVFDDLMVMERAALKAFGEAD